MESINDVIEYIDSNREYIESREEGLYVSPDIYIQWLEEDIAIGKLKQHVEFQKILAEQQRNAVQEE